MKISVLCTDQQHPVVPKLQAWCDRITKQGHSTSLCFDKSGLTEGDLLFLVSCSQLMGHAERAKFRTILVLHASDLPSGRGWSPHIWSILKGAHRIGLCLLEAQDPVDTGPVWFRTHFELEGHELLPEINEKLFAAELQLMTRAVENYGGFTPVPQTGAGGPYLRRRTREDSRLDVNKTLAEQFDLLRIVDNQRYPAFFDHRGKRYLIKIEKAPDEG